MRHVPLRAIALASLLLTGVAVPTGQAAPGLPRLGGSQVLSAGPGSARALVEIPADVVLPGHADCRLSRTARFQGTAEQAIVVLTRLPLSPDSRIHWIAKVRVGGVSRVVDSECTSERVEAGRYLLQYLHTPGTSSVRLQLPGLRGRSALRLREPDRSVIAALPSVLGSPADPATHSWGLRRSLSARGSVLTIGFVAAGLSNRGADAQGDCLLDEQLAAVPDPVAYAPGCPLGGSGLSEGFTGDETWQATLTSNLAPGSYGAGYWFVGTPTHRPLGAVSAWLTNLG